MALERLPYFKFHCADYLLDTLALTMSQHGAYCLLLVNYYWNGSLPSSRDEQYALCRADTQEKKTDVDFVIGKFFKQEGDALIHSRVERERGKLGDLIRSNSIAGKASAEARAKKRKPALRGNGAAEGFEEFYAAYPRRVGRAKAEKAWTALHPDEALRASILLAVRRQSASEQWTKDGGKFIPHPASWLNGKRWEDETAVQMPKRVAI